MQSHGFNKSSFNYISPYGVHYLMTNGKMEGVGRKSASLPVFNKRLQLAESESVLKAVRKGSIEGPPTEDFCLDDFNDDNYEVVISSQKPTEVSLEQLYLSANENITQVRNPSSRRNSPTRERGTDCSDSDPLSGSGSYNTGRGDEICAKNNSVAEVRVISTLSVASPPVHLVDVQAIRIESNANRGAGDATHSRILPLDYIGRVINRIETNELVLPISKVSRFLCLSLSPSLSTCMP